MRRKDNVFVRDITHDELKKLNKIKNSRNSELRERALIVLHSSAGKTVPEIQQEILRARNTVLHWIRRFNHYGLDGLINRKPPGAKERFTPEVRQRIGEIARTNPADLGMDHDKWSLARLRDYLIEQEVIESISIESVRICLLKEDVSLVPSMRKVHALRKPAAEFRRLASVG